MHTGIISSPINIYLEQGLSSPPDVEEVHKDGKWILPVVFKIHSTTVAVNLITLGFPRMMSISDVDGMQSEAMTKIYKQAV